MRVCFASMESYHGCVDSCRHAAAVLGGSAARIAQNGAVPLAVFDAEIALLSSWHPAYEPLLGARGVAIVPRWHSTLLHSELAEEGSKLARLVRLLDEGAIPALAVNDPALATALGRDCVVVFPDVLHLAEHRDVVAKRLRGTNVSLFGAPHGGKNLFVQSAAFEQVRRARGSTEWTLHLSGQSFLQPGALEWLEATGIPFVDHGWLGRAEYLALVAAMDAGLCATLTESYCYVAADHTALGVPVVASPSTRCLSDGNERARARPDDVGEVAASLDYALAERTAVARGQSEALAAQAEENALLARSALAEIESLTRHWRARRGAMTRDPVADADTRSGAAGGWRDRAGPCAT